MGYPPVQGRFYTRYAPVRRSSADCKQSLLPLDLHVLSLPLAFILSQDQTLHCISLIICMNKFQKNFQSGMVILLFVYAVNFNTFNERGSRFLLRSYFNPYSTRSLSCQNPRIELDYHSPWYFQNLVELRLSLKAGANVKTIFYSTTQKIYFF